MAIFYLKLILELLWIDYCKVIQVIFANKVIFALESGIQNVSCKENRPEIDNAETEILRAHGLPYMGWYETTNNC